MSAVLRPWLQLSSWRVPTFQVCGYTGFVLGFIQSMLLTNYLDLSLLTMVGITGVVILTFYSLVMITKIIVGFETIIYYHHELAVVATTTLFLLTTGQTVLAYLDIAILGVGLFLACGRVGCLMVGCCHGRPASWGVTYGREHVDAGFPAHLEGVRLLPIQAIESVFALVVVTIGVGAVVKGYPPGTAFTFYVLIYAAGRFCFEFVRGDSGRPYLWGFSEAQWISLIIAIADVRAEQAHLLPSYHWHAAVPLLMLTATLAIGLKRRSEWPSSFDLMHPNHIRELAEAVQLLKGTLNPLQILRPLPAAFGSNVIHVAKTSLGFRISAGELTDGSDRVRHYSLSEDTAPLSASSARLLADTIGRLHHPSCSFELMRGESGVFHVVFGPDPTRSVSRGK